LYLKTIVINGFKSFPDKKEFKIDNGITGVVGPNGSGKSNVSDAVRWVLGEQSPKSLRGSKMLDVIFGGTDTRKQKSFCEVCLVFDNHSNMLSTDFSEVHIARKLYRSGESTYSINKANSRLKDIQELFRDTGIGKEGYSIIGQGRIDEILTEKGTERRKIFEEAAGIMKYRVRKEEAERKLTRTKDNLVRIKDISGELGIQIAPLKKQCEQTKQYIELVDRQKILEVNLYIDAYDKHSENIAAIDQRIKEVSEEEAELNNELDLIKEDFDNKDFSEEQIDDKIERLNENITSFHMEIERLDGEINLTNEKSAFLKRDIERLEVEISQETQASIDKTSKITKMQETLELTDEDTAKISQEISDLQSDLADKTVHQQSDFNILQAIKSGVFEHLGELSNIKSGISAITTARDSAKNRIADVNESKKINDQDIEANNAEKAKLEAHFDTLNDQTKALTEQVFALSEKYEQGEIDLSKATTGLYDVEKKIEGVVSRKKMLLEMRDSFEGYYNSVKRLLLSAEKNTSIKDKVISTVASGINVQSKYETAIEIALGNAMQNIIVENDYDAKEIISYLKANNIGRVTFLPINNLKQRHLSNAEKSYLNASGVIGCASDLITFDQKIAPAIEYLLGRTVIVENMDDAISLMKKSSYSFRTVTLDGDQINPGGVITGGSVKKSQSGLLSRERVLAEMKKNQARLEKEADDIRMTFVMLRDELKRTGEKKDEIDHDQRKIEVEVASVIEKLRSLDETGKRLIEQNEIHDQKIKKIKTELASSDFEVKQLEDKQDSLVDTGDETDVKIKNLEDKYQALCDDIEAIKQGLSEKNIAITSKRKEAESLLSDLKRLQVEIDNAKAESQQKREQIEQSKTKITDLDNGVILIASSLAGKKKFVDNSSHDLEQFRQEKKMMHDKVKSRQVKKEEIRDQLTALSEKKHKADISITKAESNLEYLQNKTWDSYQLTYANSLAFKTEISLTKASKEIEKIKSKLRLMGEVNPHAIEDYDNAKTRYDYLTEQETDLENASADLEKVIAGLMDKMKENFEDKFKTINENFKQVFKELFGGGNVDLILEDKTNVMESGIQIVAEPPGKHLQNILLLSGGEKALTAIALLFALLKINPSPLCILDEIDAALDDANVNKFAEFLREFNNETQFIVITHRKPTMAICDVLYGLAMGEKGVTDVLSVSIN
jgi:chromosome segregation protein